MSMSSMETSEWSLENMNPCRGLASAFRWIRDMPGTPVEKVKQITGPPGSLGELLGNIRFPLQFQDSHRILERLIGEGMGFRFDPELLEVGGVYHYKAGDVELLLKKVDEDRIEVHEILDGPVR
ncbi:MAG: hypothetical protein KAW84_00555 [Thermoplasmata archaeon]|nr:hypothetical protein [Thermoplasmata archaeon]